MACEHTEPQLATAAILAIGQKIQYGRALSGQFGFVVAGDGDAQPQSWILTLKNGQLIDAVMADPVPDKDELKRLDLVCAMPRPHWQRLGTTDDTEVPRVLEELEPRFSGHLSFFICHLESLLKLIVSFSKAVAC